MQDDPQNIHRRRAAKMMVYGTVALATPLVLTPSRATSKRIVVRDLGGVYSQIYRDVLYNPFTQVSGIEVIGVASEPDPIAPIRTMVESKHYAWDMACLSQLAITLLTTNHVYLEQHGLNDESVISSLPQQFMSSYGVGTNVYTTVLTYRTDKFKERRAPASWKDLWDVDHFSGRRSLRKYPPDTIEAALMADGVSPDRVYSCDLDRAFHSLNKIKSHIAVWWTSGPQVEQLLKSGEVDMTSAAIARMQSAISAGAPITFSWNQHIYGCMSWAILKGTPNADACRQFIKFASDPKRQALLAPYALGPTQPDAFQYINPKHAQLLPTYPDNLKKGLFIDAAYWAKHQQAAIERFNDWILS